MDTDSKHFTRWYQPNTVTILSNDVIYVDVQYDIHGEILTSL